MADPFVQIASLTQERDTLQKTCSQVATMDEEMEEVCRQLDVSYTRWPSVALHV